ncbi:MAG: terminase, partial [Caulobacteraceae bacterium]|nr:terminase [Caulobacteraceae bacterium]
MSQTYNINYIRPQPGYQTIALSSPADIVIGGAAAFVGKTFALLLDPIRHIGIKGFGGVIFRRTSVQIRNEGGLWDTSTKLYPIVKGDARESSLDWKFPSGVKISFRHLEYEKNKYDWQGAQIPFLGFDELTHFTESMFFYLLSRNRSACSVKPYVRATCNPDPESWVYKLI